MYGLVVFGTLSAFEYFKVVDLPKDGVHWLFVGLVSSQESLTGSIGRLQLECPYAACLVRAWSMLL